jgi:Dullard-like phosphatase family protein
MLASPTPKAPLMLASPTPTVMLPAPLLPPSHDLSKPTLVLDLDETLVHATVQGKPDFPAEFLKLPNGQPSLWLAIRPHAREFLSSLAAHYELVVWTAGTEPYGRAVVQMLDPSGSFISHSLYRQHCTCQESLFIKDLRRLGRDERTRIVDNNPASFSLQPGSGILVRDFLGDPRDVELVSLLRELTPIEDVEMVDVEFSDDLLEELVCDEHLAFTCFSDSSFCSTVLSQEKEIAPKRPTRPRVSNGGPLRRSPRLARKYPRRSKRLAEKRLAAVKP